jgi:MFS family permease
LVALTQGSAGPFTPAFALKTLGASYFDLGLIGLASQVTGVFTSLIVGALSIKFYSAKLLTLGVVLNTIGVGLYATAHNPSDLVVFSLISGAGNGIFFPFVDAAVSKLSHPAERNKVFGRYIASWGSALLVGPIIGGAVGTLVGVRDVFLVSALIGGASIIVVVTLLEPNLRDRTIGRDEFAQVAPERILKLYPIVVITLLNAFIIGILFSIFPGYATSLSLPIFQIGLLFSTYAGVRLIFLFSPGKVARLGITKALLLSMLALALPALVLVFAKDIVSFALAFALFGTSAGIFLPTIMIMYSRAKSKGGVTGAMGVFESMSGAGSMVGPVVGGFVADYFSPIAPYVLCSGVGLATIPIILLMKEYRSVTQQNSRAGIVNSTEKD